MELRSINSELFNEFMKDPMFNNPEIEQPILECFREFVPSQNVTDDNEKIHTIEDLIAKINNQIGHLKKVKNIYIESASMHHYVIEFEDGQQINYGYGMLFKRFFRYRPDDPFGLSILY